MRMLVVDDDDVSLVKLKRILSVYGECDGAANGEIAMEMFDRAIVEGRPYQLVTMDIGLPGVQGDAVVSRMRSEEDRDRQPKTVILMVTTHSNVDAVVSSIKAGCDGYIIKPFSDDKIRHTLQKVGLPPPGDEMGKTKSS